MKRRLWIYVAALMGVFLGAFLALKGDRVENALKEYIEYGVFADTGSFLDISELDIELFPPAITLRQVIWVERRSYNNKTEHLAWQVSCRRVYAKLRPWPSIYGKPVLSLLELHGLVAEFPHITSSEQPLDLGRLRSPIDIKQMRVLSADLSFGQGKQRLIAKNTDLLLNTGKNHTRTITLKLTHAALHTSLTKSIPLSGRVTASLVGTLDYPQKLKISAANLRTGGVAVQGGGWIESGPDAATELWVAGRLPVQQLRPFIPHMPLLEGNTEWRLSYIGPVKSLSKHPEFSLQVIAPYLLLKNRVLGKITAKVTVSADALKVAQLQIRQSEIGQLDFTGVVQRKQGFPFEGKFSFSNFSPPSFLTQIFGTKGRIQTQMDGTGLISGELTTMKKKPSQVILSWDAKHRTITQLGAYLIDGIRPKVMSQSNVITTGKLTIEAKQTIINNVELRYPGKTVIKIDGVLAHNNALGADLRVLIDPLSLPDFGPIADIKYRGEGVAAGTIEGPYDNLVQSYTLELLNYGFRDFELGEGKATVIMSPTQIELPRATFNSGKGIFKISGLLDFTPKVVHVAMNINALNGDLQHLMKILKNTRPYAHRVDAVVTAKARLFGTLTALQGVGEISSKNLRIDAVDLGRWNYKGDFGPTFPWHAKWQLHPQNPQELSPNTGADTGERATIDGDFEMRWTKLSAKVIRSEAGYLHKKINYGPMELKGSLVLDRVDARYIRPFIGNPKLFGRVTAEAKVDGSVKRLEGKLTLFVGGMDAWGIKLGAMRGQGKVHNGEFNFSGAFLNHKTNYNIHLALNDELPFAVNGNFSNIDFGILKAIPAGLDFKASGTFFSQGNFSQKNSIHSGAKISNAALGWRDFSLHSSRPFEVNYANATYRFFDVDFRGNGIHLSMEGRAPLNGALSLKITGSGLWQEMPLKISLLQRTQGDISLTMRISGTIKQPHYAGKLSLKNAGAVIGESDLVLNEGSAELIFSGRDAEIREGHATLSGAPINFSGALVLPDGESPQMELRGDFGLVSSQWSKALWLEVQGDWQLSGRVDDLLLSGDLLISKARYTEDFKLDLKALRTRSYWRPALTRNDGPKVALQLRVRAPDSIMVSGNALTAELAADLMITGSHDRIGLIGQVTPLSGQARYNGIDFDLERATIDFTEEFRIFAQYDLRAVGKACNMDLSLHLFGDSDKLSITPTGKDENGIVDPQDALTCMQLGVRLRDFAGQDAAVGIGDTQWGAIGGLWAVSGLDQQVKKLLPVEQIRITSGRSTRSKKITGRLLLTKELSNNLALHYDGSLTEAGDHVITMEYLLREGALLESAWDSMSELPMGNLGVDLRLKWEFE